MNLTADWAAILAHGVLCNGLVDIKEKTGNISPNNQLTALADQIQSLPTPWKTTSCGSGTLGRWS